MTSERGYDSPAPSGSSLNHSYETLNMSETSSEVLNYPPQRRPHRPAPPVPVKEQFERSKATLFNEKKHQENVVEVR